MQEEERLNWHDYHPPPPTSTHASTFAHRWLTTAVDSAGVMEPADSLPLWKNKTYVGTVAAVVVVVGIGLVVYYQQKRKGKDGIFDPYAYQAF